MQVMVVDNLASHLRDININTSIAQDVTIYSPEQTIAIEKNDELTNMYKAVVQGIVLLCLVSFVGGLIVLFVCLKIVQECKVKSLELYFFTYFSVCVKFTSHKKERHPIVNWIHIKKNHNRKTPLQNCINMPGDSDP